MLGSMGVSSAGNVWRREEPLEFYFAFLMAKGFWNNFRKILSFRVFFAYTSFKTLLAKTNKFMFTYTHLHHPLFSFRIITNHAMYSFICFEKHFSILGVRFITCHVELCCNDENKICFYYLIIIMIFL